MEANERLINAVRNGPYIGSADKPGLPRISRSDSYVKRKILVQKGKSASARQNVPPAGQEYDFRRTPDSMKSGSRRVVHGCIKPQIPADTRELEEARTSNVTPAPMKIRNKLIERLDVARCPTPMPTDEDVNDIRLHYQNKPLDTSRSAWDNGLITARTDMCTDGGDLAIFDNDVDVGTPRYPVSSAKQLTIPLRKRSSGSSLKFDVKTSDVDCETDVKSTSTAALDLTENVIQYYFQKSVDKDKRIVNWLADCEEKSKSINQLPGHLPDISASRRNVTLIVEDV